MQYIIRSRGACQENGDKRGWGREREGKQEKELGGGGVSAKEGERVNDEQSSF